MKTTTQIAKHLREVYFGGNWTASNLKDTLSTVTWQQATTQVYSFNTIAVLVYHIGYYIGGATKVLVNKPLDIKDKYSFDVPTIQSEKEWQQLLEKIWAEAETFINRIEQLPDSILFEDFSDKKYGNYYRNLNGIIEHTHYHLGQIALLKKILLETDKN